MALINNNHNFIYKFIENRLGASIYKNWFKDCSIYLENDTVFLTSPNSFIKDWLISNYLDTIEDLVYAIHKTRNFEIIISVARSNSTNSLEEPALGISQELICSISKQPNSIEGNVVDYSLPLDKNMTFDTFVVGESNEVAFKAAKRIGDNLSLFNPLFTYGPSGFGKTHLLHSIAWHACKQNKKVCYISAEQYMCTFVKAMQNKDAISFKNSFRDVDVLMLDDLQFMEGKKSTQEEFCNTFAHLMLQGKQLIVAANKPPSELLGLDIKLRSRLGAGLITNITPSSYSLRVDILEQKIKQKNKHINRDIVLLIAQTVQTSVRELEGALIRLCAQVDFFNKELTLDNARLILNEMFTGSQNIISTKKISSSVATFYNLKEDDLFSNSRVRNIVQARQIAMYLCRDMGKRSFPEIGSVFGGKDHTTAIYAINRVIDNLKKDNELRNNIEKIKFNILCDSIKDNKLNTTNTSTNNNNIDRNS